MRYIRTYTSYYYTTWTCISEFLYTVLDKSHLVVLQSTTPPPVFEGASVGMLRLHIQIQTGAWQ